MKQIPTAEFVTYEQALILKELGFDEPCFAIYYSKNKSFNWHHHIDHTNDEPVLESGEFNISAPLYQQAFRFFREKHGLIHDITLSLNNNGELIGYYILIHKSINSIIDEDDAIELDVKTNNREEAESVCLDKLIEIVKNK